MSILAIQITCEMLKNVKKQIFIRLDISAEHLPFLTGYVRACKKKTIQIKKNT